MKEKCIKQTIHFVPKATWFSLVQPGCMRFGGDDALLDLLQQGVSGRKEWRKRGSIRPFLELLLRPPRSTANVACKLRQFVRG